MKPYAQLSSEEIAALITELLQDYQHLAEQKLNLDMTRGKPSSAQLDLANGLLAINEFTDTHGTDCRNYGGLDGLPEMKALFSEMLDISAEKIIVGGNSSLSLMFDALARACLFGVSETSEPWRNKPAKFLCPSPGYDRHFSASQTLGLDSIRIDMTASGPDMDQIESLVATDPSIKGVWCVPKYSNPTGVSYSDKTVDRLANMKTAADDFRIIWDNAYTEHYFDGELDTVKEIITACSDAGNPNRAYVFASTSKISFAGSGVSVFASSDENIAYAKKIIGAQAIGPDKINQLRHLALFPNLAALKTHMTKHAALLRPKFAKVDEVLSQSLVGTEVAHWTKPRGGYFTSLDMKMGSAKRAIELCAKIGVKLTAAGAPFPYGNDPNDANIRIAPSFPNLEEIETAVQALSLSVRLAALEALNA